MPQSKRRAFVRATFADPIDMTGKTVVVTGCSPGSLGFASARTLAEWGANVIATSRRDHQLIQAALREGLPQAMVEVAGLELSDRTSVRNFVESFLQKNERLDVLINCAGVHFDLLSKWQQPQLTQDGEEIHWRTNYLGTYQLTESLLPTLLKTGQQFGEARVVNVVSQLHTRGSNEQLLTGAQPYNSWVAYGLSKLALVHYTFALQRKFAGSHNLNAYCLHPGSVGTGVVGRGMETAGFLSKVVSVLSPLQGLFMMNPEEGAQTQLRCATEPELAGGQYFRGFGIAEPSADSVDQSESARLMEYSHSWLKQELV
jgi:NAD(P)-dependent dehydrogenase (short-subunit alcohol dehydrogenase family)